LGGLGVTVQCLIYHSGGELLALSLSCVIEIMRPLPIDSSSAQPPFRRGTAIIRGATTPVFDLAVLGRPAGSQPQRLISARSGERPCALLVEEVVGIRSLVDVKSAGGVPLLQSLDAPRRIAVDAVTQDLQPLLDHILALPAEAWIDRDRVQVPA
jgi:chemotaxis protein histidine kinase CheA